jgi:hypothetical protein
MDISLIDTETTLYQWHILLNRAINLNSLTINTSSSFVIIPFIQNINISVHRLHLQVNDQWFDDEQCKILMKSSRDTCN